MGKRKGREDETTAILRRAMELQSAENHGSGGSAVADLMAAAKELGIDPKYIDQAAKEVRTNREVPEGAGFWGGPLVTEREISFDGSVDDQSWEDVVQLLRSTYNIEGKCEQRGTTREWIGDNGGVDKVTATVRQDGGQIRVRLTSRLEGLAAIGYILSCLPTLFATVPVLKYMQGQAIAQWLAFLAIISTVFLIARYLITRTSRARVAEVGRTIEQIQETLSTVKGVAAPATVDSVEPLQDRLHLES